MHPSHLPIIYAEICPDEPIIPRSQPHHEHIAVYENQIQDQLSQATRVITRRSNVHEFRPRIIKQKRVPFHHSFELMERQRQIKSMKNRIENVKSMQQRKKDKNDPIVYPPYFIRGGGQDSDVRIDSYMKKALNNSNWREKQKEINKIYDYDKTPIQQEAKHRKSLKKYQYNLTPQQQQKEPIRRDQNPQYESDLPSPVFYKKQPVILKPVESTPTYITKKDIGRLPQNDIRSILDFVYNNLLYKQKDLQALKSRMVHAYGKQQIQNTWKMSMRLLQRDI